ncbi:MAG: exonuclease subunit SbcD [Cyclobacteriaceae bacterium]
MEIKILHTADWHLGKRLQDFSRLEEQKLVLEEIIQLADHHQVDLILLAGDIFDSFNPSHEAVELLYRTLKRLSKNGLRPIIAISGNHDSTQFVEAPDPMAREMGIFFYGKYDTLIHTGKLDNGLEVTASATGFMELKIPHIPFPIRIILAPYANEVLLRTYLGEEDRETAMRNLMESKWKKLANTYCDDKGVNIFAGHFFFVREGEKPESEPESERPILHIGGTQALYTSNIPQQVQYAALGHLHRFHAVSTDPFPAVYPSSPLAYSFSEADQKKQVVLVHASPGEKVKFDPIPLHQGRPLYRKKFGDLSPALEWLASHPYCFVEITFETENAIDATTRKAIMKAHDGIVNLIPLLKNPTGSSDTRLLAADLEKDMVSLFQMFYESEKGLQPNAELIEILKEVISQNEDQ